MSGDIFLKLEGIEGESIDHKHQIEIQLETVSWGASNAASFNYGGGGYHCVHVSQREMEILKSRNMVVVTCPGSNTKLASGAGKAFLEDAPRKPLRSYRKQARTTIRQTTSD